MTAEPEELSEEITAGLDGLEAQAGAPPPSGSGPTFTLVGDAKKGAAWLPVTEWGADLFTEIAANWKISPTARKLLTQGAAEILDTWMPGGVENMDQWGKWIKLLAGIGVLAAANYDWKHWRDGHFKPLQVPDEKTESRPADGGGGANPVRENLERAPSGQVGTPAAGVGH